MMKGNAICPRPFHGGGIKRWKIIPHVCSFLCDVYGQLFSLWSRI
jgi:hypothetical protein